MSDLQAQKQKKRGRGAWLFFAVYLLLSAAQIPFVKMGKILWLNHFFKIPYASTVLCLAWGVCALFFALSYLFAIHLNKQDFVAFLLLSLLPVFVPLFLFQTKVPAFSFALSFSSCVGIFCYLKRRFKRAKSVCFLLLLPFLCEIVMSVAIYAILVFNQ